KGNVPEGVTAAATTPPLLLQRSVTNNYGRFIDRIGMRKESNGEREREREREGERERKIKFIFISSELPTEFLWIFSGSQLQ
ncbi:hypothetical protein ALC57_10351, partial [Trachymyrmex cornetzi]